MSVTQKAKELLIEWEKVDYDRVIHAKNNHFNLDYSNIERYKMGKVLLEVEGMQMVVILQGDNLNFSRLPLLYRPKEAKLHII